MEKTFGKFSESKRKIHNIDDKRKSFAQSITFYDLFPSPVRLTFRGRDRHKTPVGATASILCVVFVLIYSLFRAFPLFNENRTKANMNTLLVSEESKFFKNKELPSWSKGVIINPNVSISMGFGD